jgi:hypothetical protein
LARSQAINGSLDYLTDLVSFAVEYADTIRKVAGGGLAHISVSPNQNERVVRRWQRWLINEERSVVRNTARSRQRWLSLFSLDDMLLRTDLIL